jgi:hypothetical protein
MCARAVENRVGVRCSRAPILNLNFYTAYRPAEVCALRTADGGPGRSRLVSSIGSRGRGEKFRTLRKSYPHPMVSSSRASTVSRRLSPPPP